MERGSAAHPSRQDPFERPPRLRLGRVGQAPAQLVAAANKTLGQSSNLALQGGAGPIRKNRSLARHGGPGMTRRGEVMFLSSTRDNVRWYYFLREEARADLARAGLEPLPEEAAEATGEDFAERTEAGPAAPTGAGLAGSPGTGLATRRTARRQCLSSGLRWVTFMPSMTRNLQLIISRDWSSSGS